MADVWSRWTNRLLRRSTLSLSSSRTSPCCHGVALQEMSRWRWSTTASVRRSVDDIVADVLARTRLTDFADAVPRQLSGGMKQRVAIARALAVRPAVMLMDEPLSALNSQTRELLMEDLVALWDRTPFTAVYVTHNLDEAVRLGHRIAILSRRPGQVREVVELDTPLSERRIADPMLAAARDRLWEAMRQEAMDADLELSDA